MIKKFVFLLTILLLANSSDVLAAGPSVDLTNPIVDLNKANEIKSADKTEKKSTSKKQNNKTTDKELKSIEKALKNVSIGQSITYHDFSNNSVFLATVEKWKKACTDLSKDTNKHIKKTRYKTSNNNSVITQTCEIEECESPDYKKSDDGKSCVSKKEASEKAENTAAANQNSDNSNDEKNGSNDNRTDEEKAEAEQEYEDAKEKEQSKENRMLTAGTLAATGIGGMQLAQGLSEQKADKEAEQNMEAYIATMRCKYADKSVKAGPDEIELPGGNDANMMKLRAEYIALAADLKERKTALGMKPGIESEEILDKAQMGLYDDESVGITDGSYASLYRAKMLNSENDQSKLDAAAKEAKTRVIAGGVAAGAGVVGGILGDSLINGKLGELIKQRKAQKNYKEMTNEEFKEWLQQQESYKQRMSQLDECLSQKLKENNNSLTEQQISDCMK